MNLLSATKQLCQNYNIIPSRSKGQNFLIAEAVYEAMTTAGDLKKMDMVLEVGPGLGYLTSALSTKVSRVIAVELDDQLFACLQTRLLAKSETNIELLNSDILKLNLAKLDLPKGYKIIANLPYNITAIFLRTFLSAPNPPERLVLLLQKEVAERLIAPAPQTSLLSLSVQFYSEPEIIKIVFANNFWPAPKVDSAIVRMVSIDKYKEKLGADKTKAFFRLARMGFSAKRKMLKNNLANGLKIEQNLAMELIESAGFNPKVRAQELSLADWLDLFAKFEKFVV